MVSCRHDRDRESAKRVVIQKETDLVKAQAVEKRQLPKYIRQERKVREMMFRESLKISAASGFPTDPDREKQKMKQFLDTENRRYKDEQERCERKHRRQLEELHNAADHAMTELENLQAEKKRLLTEHENLKLKQQEEEYNRELREWRALLKPRKQRLEDEFARELGEQDRFYGGLLSGSNSVSADDTSSVTSDGLNANSGSFGGAAAYDSRKSSVSSSVSRSQIWAKE